MAETGDDFGGRGAWSGDDQARTARAAWTSLPDEVDEGSDIDRGARAFARALLKRKSNSTSAGDSEFPTVVLFPNDWRDWGKINNWSHIPEVDDGSRQLSGFIFVAPPNLGAAYASTLPAPDLGVIFDWIENNLELGAVPAIVLNPTATIPALRVYEEGVTKPDKKQTYPLYLAELNLAMLDELLCRFWRDVVCAPGGGRKCKKLWKDVDKFVPMARPEAIVQKEMCRYLNKSIAGLRAKDEEDVPLGRLDVRLSGPSGIDEFTIVNHAVIELKVLARGNMKSPFTNTMAVRNAVEDGVRQAVSYRMPPENSRIAMLACYDMRAHAGKRGKTCFDHVLEFADMENVELRRWPLFPRSEALREYLVPGPK